MRVDKTKKYSGNHLVPTHDDIAPVYACIQKNNTSADEADNENSSSIGHRDRGNKVKHKQRMPSDFFSTLFVMKELVPRKIKALRYVI